MASNRFHAVAIEQGICHGSLEYSHGILGCHVCGRFTAFIEVYDVIPQNLCLSNAKEVIDRLQEQ